jgi:hypothetical protein
VREVTDEDGGRFGEGEQRVFLNGGVGGEDAAGETGGEGTGEEEVL